MTNQVPPNIKKERAKILTNLCKTRSQEFFKTQLDTTATVIIEGSGDGYSENYLHISFLEENPVVIREVSQIVLVKIVDTSENGCVGRII